MAFRVEHFHLGVNGFSCEGLNSGVSRHRGRRRRPSTRVTSRSTRRLRRAVASSSGDAAGASGEGILIHRGDLTSNSALTAAKHVSGHFRQRDAEARRCSERRDQALGK